MTSPLPRLTLVLGGARSGKSRYGEQLDHKHAVALDLHRHRRGPGRRDAFAHRYPYRPPRDGWTTREVPLNLTQAINDSPAATPVLVDCLTLWLSNVMLADLNVDKERASLCTALEAAPGPLVLISNEVGLGIVPETPLGREFRDAQGRLNAEVAAIADHVVFLAAGLPLVLKPRSTP